MSDYNYYDPSADQALSYQWQTASDGLWDISNGYSHWGDQLWLEGDTQGALQMYQNMYQFEDFSNQAYQQSWDAWYGPVNSEGYTAYDASHGYTTMDTSFIEPATSAGSMSMISDYTAESSL